MRLVHGHGINDVDYKLAEREHYIDSTGKKMVRQINLCQDYREWRGMLERCFSEKFKRKRPTYRDVTCCEEWLFFSSFKSWKNTQRDTIGKQLDKDIIIPNNKVYSPQTCAYVSCLTNNFILESSASRGVFLLGVYFDKQAGRFKSQIRNPFTKTTETLGRYTSQLDAHEAWRKRKFEFAQIIADTETDIRVVDALKIRYREDCWYARNPTGELQ